MAVVPVLSRYTGVVILPTAPGWFIAPSEVFLDYTIQHSYTPSIAPLGVFLDYPLLPSTTLYYCTFEGVSRV